MRASDETRATTSASRFAGVGKRDKGDRVRAVRKAREIVRWGCCWRPEPRSFFTARTSVSGARSRRNTKKNGAGNM